MFTYSIRKNSKNSKLYLKYNESQNRMDNMRSTLKAQEAKAKTDKCRGYITLEGFYTTKSTLERKNRDNMQNTSKKLQCRDSGSYPKCTRHVKILTAKIKQPT